MSANGGRTDRRIFRSPWPDVQIPDVPFAEFVLGRAASLAEKPALVDGPSGRTVTYGQLADGARRVAVGLGRRGFGTGDVCALYSPNLPELAVAFFGIASSGGTITTVNPLYTADELARQLVDAGARYLLTVPPLLDKALDAARAAGIEEVFVFGEAEGATPFGALLADDRPPPSVRIDPAE